MQHTNPSLPLPLVCPSPEHFFLMPPSMSVQYPRTYFLNARGVLRGASEGCFPRAQGCFLPSTFSQCEGRFGIRGYSAYWLNAKGVLPEDVCPIRGAVSRIPFTPFSHESTALFNAHPGRLDTGICKPANLPYHELAAGITAAPFPGGHFISRYGPCFEI